MEAQRPEYLTDGFFLKHFKQFPDWVDPNNLSDEQKEFIMVLTAVAPTTDNLAIMFQYQVEERRIKDRDWTKAVKTHRNFVDRPDMLKSAAAAKQMTVDEYLETEGTRQMEVALEALRDRYTGILFEEKSDAEEVKQEQKRKFGALADRVSQGTKYGERYRDILKPYIEEEARQKEAQERAAAEAAETAQKTGAKDAATPGWADKFVKLPPPKEPNG